MSLHSGGDAGIPAGPSGKGGFCDDCQYAESTIARERAQAAREARVAALRLKRNPAPQTATPPSTPPDIPPAGGARK